MGDVEDPDIYAAEPMWQWQQTTQGQWVMQHAHNLTYHRGPDSYGRGYEFVIRGDLSDPHKQTEYFLRWPTQNKS